MGALRRLKCGRVWVLHGRTLVGRSTSCSLILDSQKVSAEHARLSWTDGAWWIRDLGSRNGTLLDGKRIKAGVERPLSQDQEISFGSREQRWVLVDSGPPTAVARLVGGGDERVAEDRLLALPDGEHPSAVIEGFPDGSWTVEIAGTVSRAHDLSVIIVDGQAWQLHLPELCEATRDESHQLVLRFEVSLDEEHVRLEGCLGERRADLGDRAHNYLLLTLARRRLEDEKAGLPAGERGWIYREVLLTALRLDPQQLNLLVFRARKCFAKAALDPTVALIERRLDTGQIRIGVAALEIASP